MSGGSGDAALSLHDFCEVALEKEPAECAANMTKMKLQSKNGCTVQHHHCTASRAQKKQSTINVRLRQKKNLQNALQTFKNRTINVRRKW